MSNDETYEGWKNHETWAFNLHWSNDEGLYNMVREWGEELIRSEDEADSSISVRDYELGRAVIERMKTFIEDYEDDFGAPLPDGLKMYRDEVGSWWRIDETEIGASVRESLS
jgi:hypothetical protein